MKRLGPLFQIAGLVAVVAAGVLAPVPGASAETPPSLTNCLAAPEAATSAGMFACVVHATEEASSEMKSAYQHLRAALDPTSRDLLDASQEAWEAYRVKDLAFVHAPWHEGSGTFEQLNIAMLRLDELRARTRTLEGYLPNN